MDSELQEIGAAGSNLPISAKLSRSPLFSFRLPGDHRVRTVTVFSHGIATVEHLDLYNRLAGNLRRLLKSIGLERKARPVSDGSHVLADYFRQPPPKPGAAE